MQEENVKNSIYDAILKNSIIVHFLYDKRNTQYYTSSPACLFKTNYLANN